MFIIDDYFLLMIAKFEDGLPLRDCNIQVEAATFIWCATRTLYYCWEGKYMYSSWEKEIEAHSPASSRLMESLMVQQEIPCGGVLVSISISFERRMSLSLLPAMLWTKNWEILKTEWTK